MTVEDFLNLSAAVLLLLTSWVLALWWLHRTLVQSHGQAHKVRRRLAQALQKEFRAIRCAERGLARLQDRQQAALIEQRLRATVYKTARPLVLVDLHLLSRRICGLLPRLDEVETLETLLLNLQKVTLEGRCQSHAPNHVISLRPDALMHLHKAQDLEQRAAIHLDRRGLLRSMSEPEKQLHVDTYLILRQKIEARLSQVAMDHLHRELQHARAFQPLEQAQHLERLQLQAELAVEALQQQRDVQQALAELDATFPTPPLRDALHPIQVHTQARQEVKSTLP